MLTNRRIALSRLAAVPIVIAVLFSTSRWESRPLVAGLLFLGGCILVSIAVVGRLWCSLYISGYKTEKLITYGPYSWCRNPLYLFSLCGAAGVGLSTETVSIPAAIALLFAVYYPIVITAEEQKLSAIHGQQFEAYLKLIPRFWPRSFRIDEPEQYVVNPKIFRKSMLDALWFVVLVGLIKLFRALQGAGLLPALWRLY